MKSNFHRVMVGFIVGLLSLGGALSPLHAAEKVIVKEHVSTEWADVLRVKPIMQTMTATRNEQVCNSAREPEESRPQKWIDSIRDLTRRKQSQKAVQDMLTGKGCRIVKVEREFSRPISYEVDYTFRGMKFRTRLPEDPGSRLKIRVGVTPIIE